MSENELETIYCIMETVEELSPRQREVLELVVQGYTQREVGEMLGISRTAVLEYLKRARANIRKVVEAL